MTFFTETDRDSDLYPATDPNVLACQAALQSARAQAEPATHAWKQYLIEHCDEATRIPFERAKQRLFDQLQDAGDAVTEAEVAYTKALDLATARATAAWDEKIRAQFLDDIQTIEAFIAVLERHEATVIEAQSAGVKNVVSVPMVFITAGELRTRLDYAKRELGFLK